LTRPIRVEVGLASRIRDVAVSRGERINEVIARAIEPKLTRLEKQAISRYQRHDVTKTSPPD
jgi:hypothetical protein